MDTDSTQGRNDERDPQLTITGRLVQPQSPREQSRNPVLRDTHHHHDLAADHNNATGDDFHKHDGTPHYHKPTSHHHHGPGDNDILIHDYDGCGPDDYYPVGDNNYGAADHNHDKPAVNVDGPPRLDNHDPYGHLDDDDHLGPRHDDD